MRLWSLLIKLVIVVRAHDCEVEDCDDDGVALLRMPKSEHGENKEVHALTPSSQHQKESLDSDTQTTEKSVDKPGQSWTRTKPKLSRGPGWVPDERLYKECWDLFDFGYSPTLCCPSVEGYGFCSDKKALAQQGASCPEGRKTCWGHSVTLERCCPDYGKSMVLKPRFRGASSTAYSYGHTGIVDYSGENTVLGTGNSQKMWMSAISRPTKNAIGATLNAKGVLQGGRKQWLQYDFDGKFVEVHRLDVSLQSNAAKFGQMPEKIRVQFPNCKGDEEHPRRAPYRELVSGKPGKLWQVLTEEQAHCEESDSQGNKCDLPWKTRIIKYCEKPWDWTSARCTQKMPAKDDNPNQWPAEVAYRLFFDASSDNGCDQMAVSSVEFMGREVDQIYDKESHGDKQFIRDYRSRALDPKWGYAPSPTPNNQEFQEWQVLGATVTGRTMLSFFHNTLPAGPTASLPWAGSVQGSTNAQAQSAKIQECQQQCDTQNNATGCTSIQYCLNGPAEGQCRFFKNWNEFGIPLANLEGETCEQAESYGKQRESQGPYRQIEPHPPCTSHGGKSCQFPFIWGNMTYHQTCPHGPGPNGESGQWCPEAFHYSLFNPELVNGYGAINISGYPEINTTTCDQTMLDCLALDNRPDAIKFVAASSNDAHGPRVLDAFDVNSYWQSFARNEGEPRDEWLIFDLGAEEARNLSHIQINSRYNRPNNMENDNLERSRRPEHINLQIPHPEICGGWYTKEEFDCAPRNCTDHARTNCEIDPWVKDTCTLEMENRRIINTRYVRLYFKDAEGTIENTKSLDPNGIRTHLANPTSIYIHNIKFWERDMMPTEVAFFQTLNEMDKAKYR
eukprot:gnl/TRDRNA2_/TRDRNA2_85570_c0_seq1.p1 gnl/TRDRNA2_/TRDRNA2_85570_c0~~gnl/TRDRNA2_/TRDRNA2_85570_c0_seq1.p1  ORF type:complete len:843 (-),score=104.41 gnl/TRDRNA2_/TRDRNA2_85570_c0_seq1:95-2623(-)